MATQLPTIQTTPLGFNFGDNPKSKIPLKQIVSFVERLQKQNSEVSFHRHVQYKLQAKVESLTKDGKILRDQLMEMDKVI